MGASKEQWAEEREAEYYASPEWRQLCYVESDRLGPSAWPNAAPARKPERPNLHSLTPGLYVVVVSETGEPTIKTTRNHAS